MPKTTQPKPLTEAEKNKALLKLAIDVGERTGIQVGMETTGGHYDEIAATLETEAKVQQELVDRTKRLAKWFRAEAKVFKRESKKEDKAINNLKKNQIFK